MAAALTRTDLGRDAGAPELAARLARAIEGEVRFGAFDRARYSTDASIYQIEPVGVVIPKTDADVQAALGIAREAGVSVVARGGGTSQAGQTIGPGLVIDFSKSLNGMLELDVDARTGCSSRSTSRPARARRWAAWPPTTPAARARSATASWSTTCSRSMP
jgi:FAD/FMN-containing dehydrogenase